MPVPCYIFNINIIRCLSKLFRFSLDSLSPRECNPNSSVLQSYGLLVQERGDACNPGLSRLFLSLVRTTFLKSTDVGRWSFFPSLKTYGLKIIPILFPTDLPEWVLARYMHIWETGFSSFFEIIFYIRCLFDLTKNNTVEGNHHL
jgi:hypothetical protein